MVGDQHKIPQLPGIKTEVWAVARMDGRWLRQFSTQAHLRRPHARPRAG
jgi:hypothetical protein